MSEVPPSREEILRVLNSSVTVDQNDRTFEVGLVLGGTVSAGAYTAGFIDKFIEALDAWYGARERGEQVPDHDVRLRVAAGTSGGAGCAAILARALASSFPHATPTTDPADLARNPFYACWVQDLDIRGMTDLSDISEDGQLLSFLNGRALDVATRKAVAFQGAPLPHDSWHSRPYVDNPFAVICALGNLTGVPYGIDFGNDRKQVYKSHADFARFACDVSQNNDLTPEEVRADTFFVQQDGREGAVNWMTLANYARASGAFPLAFPAIALRRPRNHYDYRVAVVPGESGQAEAWPLRPIWPESVDAETYSLLSVDGGTFNNEPIELARTHLSGPTGRNPRDRMEANRGVILVDPLASSSDLGDAAFSDLFSLAGSLIDGVIGQGRYATSDLMMMADESVFSRYLVRPQRGVYGGEKALATGGLGGFSGFFDEDYRHHDYMLGRANCRTFLLEEFALDENHLLFADWSDDQRQLYGKAAGEGYLPVIPLVGKAAEPDGYVPWPKGQLTAERARKLLEPRVVEIVEKIADDNFDTDLLTDPLIWKFKKPVARRILEPFEKAFAKYLDEWQL